MSSTAPTPVLALQFATIGTADAILIIAGLRSHSAVLAENERLAAELADLRARHAAPTGPLPDGVASLDAARAHRPTPNPRRL